MLDKKIPDSDLRLKKEQRIRLKDTLGEVVQGELPLKYLDKKPIIAVGDVVTDTLLEQGLKPDVAVIDGKTRRGPFEYDNLVEFPTELDIKNPPEIIVRKAWCAFQSAIEKDEPVLIRVEGEEDLLSLVAIVLCPLDGIVIYGVPSEGMVINEVSKDLKEKSWEVINNMIEVNKGV